MVLDVLQELEEKELNGSCSLQSKKNEVAPGRHCKIERVVTLKNVFSLNVSNIFLCNYSFGQDNLC